MSVSTTNGNEWLVRLLQATPEQLEAIARVLDAKPEDRGQRTDRDQSSVNSGQGQAAAKPAAVEVEAYIDKKEVGKRLGLRPRTVDDWMKRGVLPFYKPGHFVRFRWSEVQAHLAQTSRVCRRTR